jgi:diguanylate cyclase (GGDEF)-like protein/PAS domain S-box-containing protein
MSKEPFTFDAESLQLHPFAEQRLTGTTDWRAADILNQNSLLHELSTNISELERVKAKLRQTSFELEKSRARYLDLFDYASIGFVTISEQDLILECNLTIQRLLNVTGNALLNLPMIGFIHPDFQEHYDRELKLLLTSGKAIRLELKLVKSDGAIFWGRLEMSRISEEGDQPFIRIVVSDISESKANGEYLKQATTLFETAHEGVMITNAETRVLIVNSAFSEMTGYSKAEILDNKPNMFKSGLQDADFYAGMWSEIQKNGHWKGEIWNRRKNGEIFPQALTISAVCDELGRPTHYVGVYSDITKLDDTRSRLDFLTHHDLLTGLPNRLLLFARMEHCIGMARRERKLAALLILDLDGFKEVNDNFGHLVGDNLLQQVGRRLTGRVRGIDTVARLGGDEFALLLDNLMHPQDAALVATEIIQALNEPWHLSCGLDISIGASIGISIFPDHGKTLDELMAQADAALYRAKQQGRGNFNYFSEEVTQIALRRINLESLLRRAVIKKELRVVYQPQFCIASGELVGAEVLLRWNHEEQGIITPDQFIPIAEESGMICEIGEWVLNSACSQGKRWLEAGFPALKLAVNLSAHQFRHGDIADKVAAILQDTGFPAEQLELELTESALMEREQEVVSILNRLRALGAKLAIDDFGTGYSSLLYLKKFPLNILKIDKTFISEIPQQSDDKEIAAAVIGLGHTLGLKIVAEGVETEEQLNFLKEQHCDFYQGYYGSTALSAEAFTAFLENAVVN